MRKRVVNGPLSVHAISGSYVVLLGIDMDKEKSQGVLGFAIERTDHTNNGKRDWLDGFKVFPGTQIKKGSFVSTHHHPIQGFMWSDFTTRKDHSYTYRVVAMRGKPGELTESEDVSVTIDMECEDKGKHAVYFNRGVAGSQAYAKKFNNRSPYEVPDGAAFTWLSRGLEEAMAAFITQANGKKYSLRAAIYEFQYDPVLDCFSEAAKSGADVKIVFDARVNKQNNPNKKNREAIKMTGLGDVTIPRKSGPSYISHNKFIVLLKNNKPVQVWTGSTNITAGGIFGHSNVGHIVRDPKVAAKYFNYWQQLSQDMPVKDLRTWNDTQSPVAKKLPAANSTTAIFSPRASLEALEWYSQRMDKAPGPVFFTAAFGVNDLFEKVLETHKDYLRYILLDCDTGGMEAICKDKFNVVAEGSLLDKNAFDKFLKDNTQFYEEKLSGLNQHARYIHTKYMLIDPMGEDPLVISGSANFSNASTKNNDENMLVVRGDKRVADIYLGEFMRLFKHYYFRRIVKHFNEKDKTTGKKGYLATDDSWMNGYFEEDNPKFLERKYFA